jgi:hypothetical protein
VTFARIIYSRSLDLIGQRIDAGQASPTDEEIARHCGLDEAASVRSLLADLADRGDITIRGTGGDRVILLGRQRAGFTAPARPIRAVRKPLPSDDAVIEAGLAKIKAALARGKAAVGPASRNTPEASGTARKAPSGTVLAVPSRDTVSTSPIIEPAPAPNHPVMEVLEAIPPTIFQTLLTPAADVEVAPFRELPPSTGNSRTVGVPLSIAAFDRVYSEARERNIAVGRRAKQIFEAALERPRIPGAVTSAAVRAGVPVIDFAAMLMLRGLETYQGASA